MNAHSLSPATLLTLPLRHAHLLLQMIKRDVIGRYRGSLLGIAWSLVNPLIMLAVYGFVFSVVFKARWGDTGHTLATQPGAFPVILFSGLMLHGFFIETITRATSIILGHTNFVKKVVFPLEILVPSVVGSALFHLVVNIGLLLIASLLLFHTVPWTIIFMPLVLLPFILLSLGIGWMLASLGVYLRDISQMLGIIATVLLFISPVFFPLSTLPHWAQMLVYLNPLSCIVDNFRAVVLWGQLPNWTGLSLYTSISAIICWMGFAWFQKTRKGFADVL